VIPSAQKKTWIIRVVIVMVMCEEQMADVDRCFPHPLHLLRRRRTTVEHQMLFIHLKHKATAETLRGRLKRSAADYVKFDL
jgi:hypothetical protein